MNDIEIKKINQLNVANKKRMDIFILENSESSYQAFSSKLLPGVNNLVGVRVPLMHKFTNQLIKEGIDISFMECFTNQTFEETMIEAMLIAKGDWKRKDRKKLIRGFVPKIANWSHCDTFCKFIKDVDDTYLTMIRKYALAKSEYRQRFAVVMLLEHFIEADYVDTIFDIVHAMQPNGYYSKMAIAWLLSMMYNEFPNEITQFLKTSKLDSWTKNKTIQKIGESLKTNEKDMIILNDLKTLWA